jgi:Rha family phage regulatory protein
LTKAKTTPTQITMFDAQSLLEFSDDRLYVSSLDVAHHFDKLHYNVLRSIEALECSNEFRALNFEASSYPTAQNKQMPMFRMTRDGFSMLVMSFTGAKAAYWRERYIEAFNLMESELRKQAIVKAETRGRSKTIRVAATDSYKDHGASEWFHYTNNTDAIYEIVFGGTAAQLRRKWGLPAKANLRDNLATEQLNTIIQIEGAITLQLEARKITNPADQLRVVRHVALSYRNIIEAPRPSTARPLLREFHAAILSSLSGPRMTIFRASSGSGRWSALASSHGARSQASRSSSVVRMTGIALGWIGATTAFGAVVRKP